MKHNNLIRYLEQGDFFGEIALLTDTERSATIKSTNYCTLAGISRETFHDMCDRFNEIYFQLRQKALKYSDPWKQFRLKLLKQIDFFESPVNQVEFLDQVHYFMQEEYFDA